MNKHKRLSLVWHSRRLFSIVAILALALTACSAIASSITQEPIHPTAVEGTVVPTPSETIPTTPTAEATKLDALSQMALDYIAGQAIDTSALTPEQRTALSSKIVEQLESQRGPQVIYYENAGGSIAYLNVATGQFEQAPKSALQNPEFLAANTPRAYEPISFDGQGNVIILDTASGEAITVQNSAGMDWTAVDSEHMERINWPTANIQSNGEPRAKIWIGGGADGGVYLPLVFEHTQLVDLPTQYGGTEGPWSNTKAFVVLTPLTDAKGHLLGFRRVFALAVASVFQVQIESSNYSTGFDSSLSENVNVPKTLKPQTIYYMNVFPDQMGLWNNNNRSTVANLHGIIEPQTVPASVKGQATDPANAVILTEYFIERTSQ